jgi:hypothetical protein
VNRGLSCLLLWATVLVAAPVQARPALTVAVGEFVDESVDGFRVDAGRMHREFATVLATVGAGRLRVIPVEQVEQAMRAQRLRPPDLLQPLAGVRVAAAVGARWLVAGRWTALEVDRPELPPVPDDLIRPVLVHAGLEVWVVDAAARRLVLRELFATTTIATGNHTLQEAARAVLRQAAARVAGL